MRAQFELVFEARRFGKTESQDPGIARHLRNEDTMVVVHMPLEDSVCGRAFALMRRGPFERACKRSS
jgi:hypothetical protein